MVQPARSYGPHEAGELVPGSGERYRRHGLRAAAAAGYRSDQAQGLLRVEIFELPSRLNAFGLLAEIINEMPDPAEAEAPGVLEIREAGLLSPGQLIFFRDRHLVRLVMHDVRADGPAQELELSSRETLPPLARHMAGTLPGQAGLPPELALLPRPRRVRRSERYHERHLLELETLGPGVSSHYGDPGPRFQLGVTFGHPEPAWTALRRTLGQVSPLPELGDHALVETGDDGGLRFFAHNGRNLAVVLVPGGGAQPRRSLVLELLRLTLFPPPPPEVDPEDAPPPWLTKQGS
jgi:hypothetical protein